VGHSLFYEFAALAANVPIPDRLLHKVQGVAKAAAGSFTAASWTGRPQAVGGRDGRIGAWRTSTPPFLLRRIINPIAAKLGIATLLAVRGRSSGTWRTTPVNVLELDGVSYLVASWGETQWARNLRAAGGGELRRGRSVWPFTAVEVDPSERPPIIAAYRAKFGSRPGVRRQFAQLPDSADHPVFRLSGQG
jgi:deazaflavin-dependent oxidoreductase (nitroreductase family)